MADTKGTHRPQSLSSLSLSSSSPRKCSQNPTTGADKSHKPNHLQLVKSSSASTSPGIPAPAGETSGDPRLGSKNLTARTRKQRKASPPSSILALSVAAAVPSVAWRPRRRLRFRLHIERREERDLPSRSKVRKTSHLSSPRHFLRRPSSLGHSPAPTGSAPPSRTQRYDPTCLLPVGDSWAVGCCEPVTCSSSPSRFFLLLFFFRERV